MWCLLLFSLSLSIFFKSIIFVVNDIFIFSRTFSKMKSSNHKSENVDVQQQSAYVIHRQ